MCKTGHKAKKVGEILGPYTQGWAWDGGHTTRLKKFLRWKRAGQGGLPWIHVWVDRVVVWIVLKFYVD